MEHGVIINDKVSKEMTIYLPHNSFTPLSNSNYIRQEVLRFVVFVCWCVRLCVRVFVR